VTLPAEDSQKPIHLIITAHPSAPRAAELALALSRRGRQVRVFLAPGAEAFSPLASWLPMESMLGICPALLDSSSSFEGGAVTVVAPAPLALQGALRATDTDHAVVDRVLSHRGPVALVPPHEDGATDHALAAALRRDLTAAGIHVCPPAPQPVPFTLPPSDSTVDWLLQIQVGQSPAPHQQVAVSTASDSSPQSRAATYAGLPAMPGRKSDGPWSSRHLLITGGPTRETIDPVHSLTTHGNGHLAWHFAAAALDRGAQVTLVLGAVPYPLPEAEGLTVLRGTTADDMLHLALDRMDGCDGLILADDASVLRAERPYPLPVLRSGNSVALRMVETPDLAQALAFRVRPGIPVSLVQLAPLQEGTSPGQSLGRRRLRAIALLDQHPDQTPTAGSMAAGPPSHQSSPTPLEELFLRPGGKIALHTATGPEPLETGHAGLLLDQLTGWGG
jgi:hypothetical protein